MPSASRGRVSRIKPPYFYRTTFAKRSGRCPNSRYLYGQRNGLTLSSPNCPARSSPSTILRHWPSGHPLLSAVSGPPTWPIFTRYSPPGVGVFVTRNRFRRSRTVAMSSISRDYVCQFRKIHGTTCEIVPIFGLFAHFWPRVPG